MLREVKNVVQDHPAQNWQELTLSTSHLSRVGLALVILEVPIARAESMTQRYCRTVD